jgi:putative intracellular protease/amidase
MASRTCAGPSERCLRPGALMSPVAEHTGWPICFWWSESTHPYWEFNEQGCEVEIASPDGGALEGDSWSDHREKSGYSAYGLISLRFVSSPKHAKLVESSKSFADVETDDYDTVMFVGGQAPMHTFIDDDRAQSSVGSLYDQGKVTAVICHATGMADQYVVNRRMQPFSIEDEAKTLDHMNFIVGPRFKPAAVRYGN